MTDEQFATLTYSANHFVGEMFERLDEWVFPQLNRNITLARLLERIAEELDDMGMDDRAMSGIKRAITDLRYNQIDGTISFRPAATDPQSILKD